MCDEYKLVDVWRVQNQEKREYSWFKRGNILKASRIDFALVSAGLDQKAENVMYKSTVQTDHRALYMVIDLDFNSRGTGYWKFNNQLLHDIKYVEFMNREIQQTILSSSNKNACETWDILKKRIKKQTQEYSRQKISQKALVISQLSETVNNLEARLPLNKEEDNLLTETKVDLEEKLVERTRGAIFRSKVRWTEEGEKNSKYFFNLEKARYNAKTCYKMITEQGQEVVSTDKILNEQWKFYKDLYSEDEDVKFDLENRFEVRVPEDLKKQQNAQIEIKELGEALMSMNKDKTPGEDGLSADFYKVFWIYIKQIFYNMMLEVFEKKMLNESSRKGVLNLIPKAGKDTRLIKNLRPITLLNTDYKLIEKAIANKMTPALKHIIHQDQRGFMKERRISVNIRKFLDIMHHVETQDLEAVVLSLDFVKCFDKCSYSILHGSLEFFEFGCIVQQWTKILYEGFVVKIQNNGHFSEQIDIKKGVHQGGCCSSIYFLVIAEILALSLRDNETIEGITIKEIKNILNQFADDMDVFSLASESSLRAIFEELNSFYYQSGFKVSYDKTTLYRIGSLRHSKAQMFNLTEYAWSNNDICVLGVTIAHHDIVSKNYEDIVVKAKKILDAWFQRGLSLIGKVQVVNTLIASLFVYKMMVLPTIPINIVKKVDNMIRDFIWNKKKSKIAYDILQLPKKEGGLNLVNLQRRDKALKATWPQILVQEDEYSKIVYHQMRCDELKEDIWRCRIEPRDIDTLKIRNHFWRDVLAAWGEYNATQELRYENQIIWYNSNIRIDNKIFYWRDVHRKGLYYVHQLYENRSFKTHELVYQEFGLSKLRYNSLKLAIPKAWKEYFGTYEKSQYMPLPPHIYDTCIERKGLASQIYKFMSDDVIRIHNKYLKWNQELNGDFCQGICEFAKMHLSIYVVTNISKYRSFQYRLLQRGLVTNIQLKKWGMEENDLCYFCQKHRETLLHLFWECEEVQALWKQVVDFLKKEFKVNNKELCASSIISNDICQPRNHAGNFICLLTKQFIYSQRCLKKDISFPALKAKIFKIQSVEKYIAAKNQKLDKHYQKWGPRYTDMDRGKLVEQYIQQYIENS